jgi:phosphatidylethanolamine/phosphatidyl-N-methylethanolamine N-methyltransferase
MAIDAQTRYDKLSGLYDLIFTRILNPGRQKVISQINTLPPSHILEIGVGTGITLNQYNRSHAITGIDISGKMLDSAKERKNKFNLSNVNLMEMDAQKLAFPDNSFDVVVALYVVSTVDSPALLMSEIGRVCKPGGRVFILNHFSENLKRLEKWFLPISNRLGWKSYFERAQIYQPALHLASVQKVNMFGYWQLLEFKYRH